MNVKPWLAAAGMALLPLSGNAGVVYEWHALNDQVPWGITLALEFDRKTVRSGAFDFALPYGTEKPTRSGLLGMEYSFPSTFDEGLMHYTRKEAFRFGIGEFRMHLRFEADGFLSGYIYANDGEHHFEMASSGTTFAILDANSDAGMDLAGCGWTTEVVCAGAAGVIRQTRITQVPEPGTAALFGLGLLAAYRTGRRRIA